MSHFIELCLACRRVIRQCRCPMLNKSIIWSTCDDCAGRCREVDSVDSDDRILVNVDVDDQEVNVNKLV